MTQEEKDLLLKDLCARLPYGIKVLYDNQIFEIQYIEAMYEELKLLDNERYTLSIEDVKPYLFPLSSMTDEQKTEHNDTLIQLELKSLNDEIEHHKVAEFEIDFYNKNMFDYRGLIDKGLALDATNKNIY